jgi:hypothetical protein
VKTAKYVSLFVIGIIITEISLVDLFGYILLAIVRTNAKYFLDICIFVVGFMVGFYSLKKLNV